MKKFFCDTVRDSCYWAASIFIFVSLVAMSGCAGTVGIQADALESEAVKAIAGANDRALALAEEVQCRGISVGAWVRRYGSNPALAAAWRTLCASSIQETPSGK